jgi:xanthine dehydrogenase accessory factor
MFDEHIHKIDELQKKNEPFAIATVVWRAEPSSGKSGDKAIIDKKGEITGWVGGGCVRGIVLKEADDAIRSGKTRLVKIGQSVSPGQKEGIVEYKMTCQSEGSLDVFIEPVLPAVHLVVMGKSVIAKALVRLGKAIGYRVTAVATDVRPDTFEKVDELITRISLDQVKTGSLSFIVVCTQGEGDEDALKEALRLHGPYVGFVASRKKKAAVFAHLVQEGADPQKLAAVRSPAGIDINAKKPDEVAISILAEIIQVRNGLSVVSAEEGSPTNLARETNLAGPSDWRPEPKFYINPVCGIPVDINNPRHVIDYKGEQVYFCCDGCKIKFEESPEKYMEKK